MSVTAWYVTAMSLALENIIEKVTDLRLENLLYFVNPSLLELLSSLSVSWNCIFQKWWLWKHYKLLLNFCSSCFSKLLKNIMYNRLYKNLCKEKLVYSEQFGFQEVQSTENILLVVETEPTWFTQTKKYLPKKNVLWKTKFLILTQKARLLSNHKISYNYIKNQFSKQINFHP